jgi:hypothetical protein
LEDKQEAKEIFSQALKVTQLIQDKNSKAFALIAIATASSKLKDGEQAILYSSKNWTFVND